MLAVSNRNEMTYIAGTNEIKKTPSGENKINEGNEIKQDRIKEYDILCKTDKCFNKTMWKLVSVYIFRVADDIEPETMELEEVLYEITE